MKKRWISKLISLFGLLLLILAFDSAPAMAIDKYIAYMTPAADYTDDGYLYYIPVNPDGTLGTQVLINTVYNVYSRQPAVAIADFNENDPELDIVYGFVNKLYLFTKNGPGANFTKTTLPGNFYSGLLTAGDFNNDHHMDFAGASTDYIKIYFGNGDGTFNTPVSTYLGNYGANATHVQDSDACDINGDGILDLVVASIDGQYEEFNKLWLLLGNGNGTFQKVTLYNGRDKCGWNCNSYNPFGKGVHTDDFDCDGDIDIVVSTDLYGTGTSAHLSIMRGNGNGTFSPFENFCSEYYNYGFLFGDRWLTADDTVGVVTTRGQYWYNYIRVYNNNCTNLFPQSTFFGPYDIGAVAAPRVWPASIF